MMRIFGLALAGVAWTASWCGLGGWLTFPSTAVADRIRYEVNKASNGATQIQIGEVSPWWLGLRGRDVSVYGRSSSRSGGDELRFAAETVWARVGLWSLATAQPRAIGTVRLGGGDVDFDVATMRDERGSLLPAEVHLNAPSFPVLDLLALGGVQVEGQGAIDIAVDIDARAGAKAAEGTIRIVGSDILLTKLDLSNQGIPDLGMEIPISRFEISADITDGKAKVQTGTLDAADLGTAEITGDLTLRDDLARSLLRLDVVVTLGEKLENFAVFLKDAQGTDGKYHYTCTGTLQRVPSCRAQRASRTSSRIPTTGGAVGSTAVASQGEDERVRSREEALERVRRRREEREAAAANGTGATSTATTSGRTGENADVADGFEPEEDPMEEDEEWDFGPVEEP